MHFFQVKGVIGPCLVPTPLKNHCFAFWLQEEVAEQQDHKAGVLTLPHFHSDWQKDLELVSALLLEVMYLLLHQVSMTCSQDDKRY